MIEEDHHHKTGEALHPMIGGLRLLRFQLKMALGSKSIAIEVLVQSTDSNPPCYPLGPSQVLLHLSGTVQLEATTIQVSLHMELAPQVLLVSPMVILLPPMVHLPITPCLHHMDLQLMARDPSAMGHHMDLLPMEPLHMGPHHQWCLWLQPQLTV